MYQALDGGFRRRMRCSLCPGRRDQTCSVNPRPEVGVLEKRCLVPWRPPEEGFLELVVFEVGPGRPQWLNDKELACSAGGAGDVGLIPGSGRSSGGGNGNPLQYSCLENSQTEEPGRLQSMGRKVSNMTEYARYTVWSLKVSEGNDEVGNYILVK